MPGLDRKTTTTILRRHFVPLQYAPWGHKMDPMNPVRQSVSVSHCGGPGMFSNGRSWMTLCRVCANEVEESKLCRGQVLVGSYIAEEVIVKTEGGLGEGSLTLISPGFPSSHFVSWYISSSC